MKYYKVDNFSVALGVKHIFILAPEMAPKLVVKKDNLPMVEMLERYPEITKQQFEELLSIETVTDVIFSLTYKIESNG